MILAAAFGVLGAAGAARHVADSLSVQSFKAAPPARRVALALAALPPSIERISRRDVAHPPILDIAADADGWFAALHLYLMPKRVAGQALCERRVVMARLRPVILEYPMQSRTVLSRPLTAYATRVSHGFLRRVGFQPCPSDPSAHYTIAENAVTAATVFDGLDQAIARSDRGEGGTLIRCRKREDSGLCAEGAVQLRSVMDHVTSIYTERPSSAGGAHIHWAEGKHWTARMRFHGRQLENIEIQPTPTMVE